MWKLLALTIIIALLIPIMTVADAPLDADITVTATGQLPLKPDPFALTWTSATEIELTWTMGLYADTTIIRGKYGSEPITRDDGYAVYDGAGESVTDEVFIGMGNTVYYSGWSQSVAGYSEDYATANTQDGMSLVEIFMLFGVIGVAYWKRNQMFLFMAASLALAFCLIYFTDYRYGIFLLAIGLYMLYGAVLETWRRR